MNATIKGLGLALLVPLVLAGCGTTAADPVAAELLGTDGAQPGAFGSAAQHRPASAGAPAARAQAAQAQRTARQEERLKTLQTIIVCDQ